MKKQSSGKRKWIWLIVVLVLIAAGIGAYFLLSGEKAIPVQTGKISSGELRQIVSASGQVDPAVRVEISANISAQIERLHVHEGEHVKKGQLLLSLDNQRYHANNQQAAAGLKAARAQVRLGRARLELAQKTFERQQDLFAKKLTTKEALDATETELRVAEASVAVAQDNVSQAAAGLRITQDELSKTTIRSPMDGVVTRLNKEEGEIALGSVFSRDVIMEVSDPGKIIATVEVDEADVVLIEVGDAATVEIDALPDRKFAATVIEIAGSAMQQQQLGTQEETVAFEVNVLLEGDTSQTRPGMSATADIVTEVKVGVFQVPIQCITMRDPEALAKPAEGEEKSEEAGAAKDMGAAVVGDISKMKEMLFRIEDNRVHPLWVETGISSDTHMEITGENLAEDIQVICGPFKTLNRMLKPDDLVEIQPGGPPM